jgi:predicted DNA-binding protein
MAKVPLTIRIEESEMKALKAFCDQTGRTQTDVLREAIRKLKIKPC